MVQFLMGSKSFIAATTRLAAIQNIFFWELRKTISEMPSKKGVKIHNREKSMADQN